MKITCIVSLLILCNCTAPSRYKAVTDHVQLSETPRKKVFIIKNGYLPNAGRFVEMINANQWIRFDKEVQALTDSRAKSFLQAIRLLIQKEYFSAYRTIEAYSDTDFDCQLKILKADCLYELKADSVDLQNKYQEAWDCTEDSRIKSIVKSRFRFVNYGL